MRYKSKKRVTNFVRAVPDRYARVHEAMLVRDMKRIVPGDVIAELDKVKGSVEYANWSHSSQCLLGMAKRDIAIGNLSMAVKHLTPIKSDLPRVRSTLKTSIERLMEVASWEAEGVY